jgi:hypothetical protein
VGLCTGAPPAHGASSLLGVSSTGGKFESPPGYATWIGEEMRCRSTPDRRAVRSLSIPGELPAEGTDELDESGVKAGAIREPAEDDGESGAETVLSSGVFLGGEEVCECGVCEGCEGACKVGKKRGAVVMVGDSSGLANGWRS